MNAYKIVVICLLFFIAMCSLMIAVDMPRMEECGTCGAHVLETWHTRSDDGEIIHICERCADIIDEE